MWLQTQLSRCQPEGNVELNDGDDGTEQDINMEELLESHVEEIDVLLS